MTTIYSIYHPFTIIYYFTVLIKWRILLFLFSFLQWGFQEQVLEGFETGHCSACSCTSKDYWRRPVKRKRGVPHTPLGKSIPPFSLQLHTHKHSHTHSYTHTHHIHTHTHTHTHTQIHTYIDTCTYTLMHTHIPHTHIHTHTRSYTNTHIHIHTYTHI